MNGSAPFLNNTMGDFATGVAALDPPLVQQTKTEIRTLANEIAKLAHQNVSAAEFYTGFLPRLCMAMGAESAGVWQTEKSFRSNRGLHVREEDPRANMQDASSLRLIANHSLPRILLQHETESTQTDVVRPTSDHHRVLQCVMAEGQPILVPPCTIHVESDRPTNPLDDSLIVVPIRVQDEIEYLLQVVQQPSGGPAAQRGYLRFVAQMADLMSDYLRRQLLREHARSASAVQDFEYWLSAIAQSPSVKLRVQSSADALADLSQSQQVLLIRSQRRPRVLALSNLNSFDPRSETVLLAQHIEGIVARLVTEQRPLTLGELASLQTQYAAQVGNLHELLAAQHIVRVPLSDASDIVAYFAFTQKPDEADYFYLQRIATAFAGLIDIGAANPPRGLGQVLTRPDLSLRSEASRGVVWRWATRFVLLSLLTLIAFVPVPQQISTTAVLAPAFKQVYYAPSNAIVEKVLIEEEQYVESGAPLLQLADRSLEYEVSRLVGEREKLKKQIGSLESEMLRNTDASVQRRLQLESDLAQLELGTLGKELDLRETERERLTIRAQQAGIVVSSDPGNRLQGRPVSKGEMLLSTHQDGAWKLQIAVPEHRLGLLTDASLQTGETLDLPVQFSLTSHPDKLFEGRLVRLAQQTTRRPSGETIVLATAIVDADQLPVKKEGAIARATIECGRVPAIWLVVRDAYWASAAKLKMLW